MCYEFAFFGSAKVVPNSLSSVVAIVLDNPSLFQSSMEFQIILDDFEESVNWKPLTGF